jgi:hypothetical protein
MNYYFGSFLKRSLCSSRQGDDAEVIVAGNKQESPLGQLPVGQVEEVEAIEREAVNTHRIPQARRRMIHLADNSRVFRSLAFT